ncbi:MAG: DoxX family protein [Streptosporangiales bacterium]|nr:DoxX family protein [Streptosporangiales bacterium]
MLHRATELLAAHSIDILRISLGVVFLAFGALKFIPGASPAEELVVRTLQTMSFDLVSAQAAMIITAVMECFIGVTMITGKLVKVGLLTLGAAFVGIMSPLVLFFGDLFPGAPTLEAQYVFKDIVLIAAGLVVAARALGAKLVTR